MSAIILETACLPLYSESAAKGRYVPTRNSLNMWNASGRARHENEIGIPVPIEFRNQHPDFFPGVLVSFPLRLPNGSTISAKQCQQDGKALMSNPNKDLGKWLLRDVLKLPLYTIVTYEVLCQAGIDSVYIDKIQQDNEIYYKISPAPLNEYDKYIRGRIIRAKRSVTPPATASPLSSKPIPNDPISKKDNITIKDQPSSLKKGMIVNHPSFGKGSVLGLGKNETVKIKFSDKTRDIKIDWLKRYDSL